VAGAGKNAGMPRNDDELIPTRASLIDRLKNWQDHDGWQEFFDTYWKLIYGVARKSGLTDTEAQDVVQETMASVARHMPLFVYNPAIGSFKTWLLNMTRWRIADQMRKREPVAYSSGAADDTSTSTGPDLLDRLADPVTQNLDAVWEAQWEQNLFDAAVTKVKHRVDPQKYQIFDLYVHKELPPEKVAAFFGIGVDQVYLTKHRISDLIKEEVKRLEKQMT
jgi:RNA polymerase sigma-70 factor (ECF subfamily)